MIHLALIGWDSRENDQNKFYDSQHSDQRTRGDDSEQVQVMEFWQYGAKDKGNDGKAQQKSIQQIAQVKIDGLLAVLIHEFAFVLIDLPDYEGANDGSEGNHISEKSGKVN